MPLARRSAIRIAAPALLAAATCSCGGSGSTAGSTATPAVVPLTAIAAAGKALFFDKSLSASGQQSCGTCHVPSRAFANDPQVDHGLPVALGGPGMDLPGFRNTPSLTYASFTPAFSIDKDGTPTGGMFRDGRSSSLAAQAQLPFLSSFEMANKDPGEVVARLRRSTATLDAFVAAFGSAVLDDPAAALPAIARAIAAFETEDPAFHRFDSKFDAWQQGTATLSAQELRGLALFNNPGKGNCTACHPSQTQGYSQHPLFTDFSYDNIGVPRNWAIPANLPRPVSPIDGAALDYVPAPVDVPADAEYAYYDLGLCGPFAPDASDGAARPDLSRSTKFCGLFKVPSLRNIAVTAPYFHNGALATLRDVVRFYVTRDINNNTGNNPAPVPAGPGGNPYAAAGTFYLALDGTPDLYAYNDLPVAFDANVNTGEAPYLAPPSAGGPAPMLNSDEIDDVVAFLCTLTDGYDSAHPDAYPMPSQCPQAATAATP